MDQSLLIVSAVECQEIVENSGIGKLGPYKVLSYEIKAFGGDVLGFLGEYFNLIVRIEQNVSVGFK